MKHNPELTHLLEVAARIVRREYLPSLEQCRTIRDARRVVTHADASHGALAMELKHIWDKLQKED